MTDTKTQKIKILIASWLEPEQVDRIRGAGGSNVEVWYEPELLRKPRYVTDHTGTPRSLSADQQARWNKLLSNADILFDFDPEDPAHLRQNAPHLKWVQATSAGIGEFLKATELDKTDLIFTTAAGVHARPLAEFAMLGLLYFFRDVPGLNALKAKKHWERYTAQAIHGTRMLVIGLGAVGQAVADDAAHFGMDVWAMRRRSGSSLPRNISRLVSKSELRSALPEVDSIVVACPLTDETRLLLDSEEIAAIKPGAVIVNIGRGAVINEVALAEALETGQIRGAALDALTVEPLPSDSPLWALPNVIISPHSASTVDVENQRIVDIFLDNLDRYLSGRPMRNQFERDRGY